MTDTPRSNQKFGTGRHVITVHEWDAHIFTWTCSCWNGNPSNKVGWGNAPYGWAQAEEQLEEHLEAHGQNKAKRLRDFNAALTAATRPKTKKEQRDDYERRMDR
jgi:hypothetical protein